MVDPPGQQRRPLYPLERRRPCHVHARDRHFSRGLAFETRRRKSRADPRWHLYRGCERPRDDVMGRPSPRFLCPERRRRGQVDQYRRFRRFSSRSSQHRHHDQTIGKPCQAGQHGPTADSARCAPCWPRWADGETTSNRRELRKLSRAGKGNGGLIIFLLCSLRLLLLKLLRLCGSRSWVVVKANCLGISPLVSCIDQ